MISATIPAHKSFYDGAIRAPEGECKENSSNRPGTQIAVEVVRSEGGINGGRSSRSGIVGVVLLELRVWRGPSRARTRGLIDPCTKEKTQKGILRNSREIPRDSRNFHPPF